jgi:dihydropteroate synthase
MILRTPGRDIYFPRRPLLMGIVNINDDSFSGDGTLDASEALEKARALIADGADIIDIGAESARTNREAISVEEEVSRLRSFLTGWPELQKKTADSEQLSPPLLSINTWRPEVVEQVICEQIDILNDMSALPDDRNARLCAKHGVTLLIMHSVGEPKVAHTHQQWPDLMGSMTSFFEEKINIAKAGGLPKQQIILDPGLDFAKQKDDNILLLKELHRIIEFGCPVLLPISRKTVIGDVLGIPDPNKRDPGTIALLTHGLMAGAHIFRVHNVRSCWEALKVMSPFIPGSLKIILNFALTADGKISTTSRSPAHFTSKKDLERLHEIRSQADAILVGRGTLEADQMSLTTPGKNPWRCVISESGKLDPDHKLFNSDGGPRHVITSKESQLPDLPATIHRMSLAEWLENLRKRPEIRVLLCEGGGELAHKLFELDVVDEINLTWAPHTLFGGNKAPGITGIPGKFLPASRHYRLIESIPGGNGETFLKYQKC